MEQQRDFKGVWIEKEVWLDKRLNALEKVILMEIDSLDNEEKGCYASNQYLAEFCQCSETKVSTAISKLLELGYLYVKSFDGRTRFLKSRLSKFERQSLKDLKAEFKNIKENNIDNNKDNKIKHKYGEYQHVLLTDEELNKLKETYSNWQELITYLDEYIEMKGYKAKSHYLCIRKWVVDAIKEKAKKDNNSFQARKYKEEEINKLFDNIDDIEL